MLPQDVKHGGEVTHLFFYQTTINSQSIKLTAVF